GLDAVRPGLGHGGARCAAQKLRPAAACRLVDRAVCRDGLAGADRGGAADALGVLDRTGASGGRRRLLHRRRGVLPARFEAALRPLPVASVRDGWQRLPLLRSAVSIANAARSAAARSAPAAGGP